MKGSFAGLPLLILWGVAALLLVFLVVRVSVFNALMQAGPEFAATVSASDPQVVLERAFAELELTGAPGNETRSAAFDAFTGAPLSEVPLLIAAREALASGDRDRAGRLIEMAHRRDPRSRYALLLLLDRHLRRGEIDRAIGEMAVLGRLVPDSAQLLVPELARLAGDPDTRDAVKRVMDSDPRMRTAVLEQLARDGADPDVILALAGTRREIDAEGRRWQRLLLNGMVERGDVARALQLWFRLTGADPASRSDGIYDEGFAGLPGLPPFNWEMETGSDGLVDLRGGSGLYVEYYGRQLITLASQLLTLPPGTHRIGFSAEGDADGEHGRLTWTLTCYPGGRELAKVPITGVDFTAKPFSASFTVPASGCASQWFRLVGNPSEFPEDQQVTISALSIDGSGRR